MNIIFDIEPIPKGRPRFTRFGGVYTPPMTRAYESTIAYMARQYFKKPLEGDVRLTITFRVKRMADLDNLVKAVTDALNGIVYNDDRQIVEIHAFRIKDKLHPCVECKIEEV